MVVIRRSSASDLAAIRDVINDAAEAYRGVIPEDCWHEPYMPGEHLARELQDGVEFWGYEEEGVLVGVMGLQDRGEVELIRHAYVRTAQQGAGIGTHLLAYLRGLSSRPLLVGTWAAATWAIRFYERNGFRLLPRAEGDRLLRRYWRLPEQQIVTSVALADARWMTTWAGPARGT